MLMLTAIGTHSKGFPQLLSMRFYAQMTNLRALDAGQNDCVRQIFGGFRTSSTKIMLHLAHHPSMTDRAIILQAKYILRARQLPDDTLLQRLLPPTSKFLPATRNANPLGQTCAQQLDTLDRCTFSPLQRQFLQDSHRSQVLRWRLGWLPGGKPRPCPYHPKVHLSRAHVTTCLSVQMPEIIQDPIST
ncbi:hypothetical protein BD408DRAFT_452538 [Parasitella parasitica]|nr:hypothetical protein BD408DRAFT_452538 [Parasitella parasitica]